MERNEKGKASPYASGRKPADWKKAEKSAGRRVELFALLAGYQNKYVFTRAFHNIFLARKLL